MVTTTRATAEQVAEYFLLLGLVQKQSSQVHPHPVNWKDEGTVKRRP